MNSAEKFRNIIREGLRSFIDETGMTPQRIEFEFQKEIEKPMADQFRIEIICKSKE